MTHDSSLRGGIVIGSSVGSSSLALPLQRVRRNGARGVLPYTLSGAPMTIVHHLNPRYSGPASSPTRSQPRPPSPAAPKRKEQTEPAARGRHAAPVSVRIRENDPTLRVRVEGKDTIVISGTASNRGIAPSTLTLTVAGKEVTVRLPRGADGAKVTQLIKRHLPNGYEIRRLGTSSGETRIAIMRSPTQWRLATAAPPPAQDDRYR